MLSIKLVSKHFYYFVFFNCSLLLAQNEVIVKETIIEQSLYHTQITIDSILGNKQFINILKFPNSNLDYLELNSEIGSNKLSPTSAIAGSHDAIAAVNGGFFNMKTGDMVTYFEQNDSIVYRTASGSIRQSEPDYFLNGAIVIDKENILRLEVAKSDVFYEKPNDELLVMLTGPMLLLKREVLKLAQIPFVTNRTPEHVFAQRMKKYY